jgi:hemolysin D
MGMDARSNTWAARRVAQVLAAGLAALALWAALVEIDLLAQGEGRLIPTARVQRIQPLEPGRIAALPVDDGDRVRRGDLLVALDTTLARADRDRLANNIAAQAAEAARLRALAARSITGFAPPDGLDPALAALQRGLLIAELAEHDAELAGLDAALARNTAQALVLAETILRLERVLPLIEERAGARARLVGQGHAARLDWLELETLRIERAQDLAGQRARRAELAADRAAIAQRRRVADAALDRRVHARLVELDRLAISLGQEFAKAEQHLAYQRLEAPIDGIVHQRAVHTLGGAVAAGETLMLLVPDDSVLEIEALVPDRDAGFLAIGQTVRIKLEAFPFTIYGTLPGKLREIGRDAVEDPRLGPSYPVRVTIADTRLTRGLAPAALAPGMRAGIDIVTARRSVAAILLAPLTRLAAEALREP